MVTGCTSEPFIMQNKNVHSEILAKSCRFLKLTRFTYALQKGYNLLMISVNQKVKIYKMLC